MRYLSKDILEEVITQRPSDSYKSNFGLCRINRRKPSIRRSHHHEYRSVYQ